MEETRGFCHDCDFLKVRCLCSTLKSIPNSTHLIILQHTSEEKHPLNTVRIMKKSFQKISILTGEDFTDSLILNQILCDTDNECALLYPHATSTLLSETVSKPPTHLIIIDGTWRKAKKIFLLSKNLKTLPAYHLSPSEMSTYRLRQSSVQNSLSTLEASSLALSFLEPQLDTTSLRSSFKKMIDLQIEKMGRAVYQANYLKDGKKP